MKPGCFFGEHIDVLASSVTLIRITQRHQQLDVHRVGMVAIHGSVEDTSLGTITIAGI